MCDDRDNLSLAMIMPASANNESDAAKNRVVQDPDFFHSGPGAAKSEPIDDPMVDHIIKFEQLTSSDNSDNDEAHGAGTSQSNSGNLEHIDAGLIGRTHFCTTNLGIWSFFGPEAYNNF